MRKRFWILVSLVAFAIAAVSGQDPAPISDEPNGRDSFTLGIEDQVRIVVWGEPDLSLEATVRPDGKITIPLAQDIDVEGMTPEEVRLLIAGRLAGFIRDPNVTVMVVKINSFKVYFLGEVSTPGMHQFFRPTRVLQAVAVAGGPTEFSKKEITLLREELGVEKRIPIDYKKLLNGDPGQDNLYLKPGDTLIFK